MNNTLRNTLCVVAALGFGLATDLEAAGKEHQYGPTGIFGNHSKTEIKVTRVEKG